MFAMRTLIFWSAMTLYAAAVISCITTLLWAWKTGYPFRERNSVAYLSPLTNIFLGLGFLVSAASNLFSPWLRIAYIAAGIFQFWPAWSLWKRRQRKKAGAPPAVLS